MTTDSHRWTAAFISINKKILISDNYAYKCFRYLGIKAETKHQTHYSWKEYQIRNKGADYL